VESFLNSFPPINIFLLVVEFLFGGINMPLSKARKGSSKKAKRKVVSEVMHELSAKGEKKRPQKQKIAIALERAGLSKKKGRRNK
jgi:hypothetical protein